MAFSGAIGSLGSTLKAVDRAAVCTLWVWGYAAWSDRLTLKWLGYLIDRRRQWISGGILGAHGLRYQLEHSTANSTVESTMDVPSSRMGTHIKVCRCRTCRTVCDASTALNVLTNERQLPGDVQYRTACVCAVQTVAHRTHRSVNLFG